MLGRSSRHLVVLVVVVAAALVVSGCGGGGGNETTSTSNSGVVTTLPSGGNGNKLEGTLIQPTSETPATFTDVFQTQPIVVFFYVSGGRDDEAVLANLKALEPSFGAYTFFYYKYNDPKQYGDLSTLMSVGYSPMVILIDRTGVVRKVWSGFVDQGSLNQSLVNLGRD
jgi:hypothetical protein